MTYLRKHNRHFDYRHKIWWYVTQSSKAVGSISHVYWGLHISTDLPWPSSPILSVCLFYRQLHFQIKVMLSMFSVWLAVCTWLPLGMVSLRKSNRNWIVSIFLENKVAQNMHFLLLIIVAFPLAVFSPLSNGNQERLNKWKKTAWI